MAFRLTLYPESDTGLVRLIGDDPAALAQLWDEVLSAGGVELPRLDLRTYGDVGLTVSSFSVIPMDGQAGNEYRYEFAEGSLVEARALGLSADLVLEVIGRDEYRCETVERLSVLEAMGGAN